MVEPARTLAAAPADTPGSCRKLVSQLETAAGDLAVDQIPTLIGELARLEATIRLRMVAPTPARPEETRDRLLTAAQAAERLTQKTSWVYAHLQELPVVSLPGRSIRISEQKLEAFIRRRTCAR